MSFLLFHVYLMKSLMMCRVSRSGDQPGQEQVPAAVRQLQGVQEERGSPLFPQFSLALAVQSYY